MNASWLPEVLSRLAPNSQVDLPLATGGVLRYVREGAFGSMLIEVQGDHTYVNGQLAEQLMRG